MVNGQLVGMRVCYKVTQMQMAQMFLIHYIV